ncbi:MAG: formylglycine-generating enzyme family protein [Armatimonadota bacterium]
MRNLLIVVLLLVVCSGVFAAGTATSKGAVKINPKDGAVMVWVRAGEFIMGSTDAQATTELKKLPIVQQELDKSVFDNETPQQRVYLDSYWMYKCEVTVAQYQKFCKATNRKMPEPPEWGWIWNHPIMNVSWQDAADYAKWAGVSLPTEAQWEKAARGTDGRIYPWGNEWDAKKCATNLRGWPNSTTIVGSYIAGASPYGCMDMAGNVWEWCSDLYSPNYYKTVPVRNPTGPALPEPGAHVLRGGSWDFGNEGDFRCAFRGYADPTNPIPFRLQRYNNGFRCAMKPVLKEKPSK